MSNPFWFQIEGIWRWGTRWWTSDLSRADVVIVKRTNGFKYVKHRNGEPRLLNDEEVKEMTWIILNAEKAKHNG